MWYVPKCLQHLEVDCLQNGFRLIEFYEQHDEYPVIRQLLELGVTNFMILEQHCCYCTKHLLWKTRFLILSLVLVISLPRNSIKFNLVPAIGLVYLSPLAEYIKKFYYIYIGTLWIFKDIHSPLYKREVNWNRNASRNFLWDRYWGCAGQLLVVPSNSPRSLCKS